MKRGDIYVVDLGPGVGREASGVCPVVIVSSDVYLSGPLFVVVVPTVGTADANAVVGVRVTAAESGYPNDLAVLARQPRMLDPSRFPEHPSGAVPTHALTAIDDKLKLELDL